MALTKKQKKEIIDQGGKKLQESRVLVFSEYSGVSTENFKKLLRELKKVNADFKVLKKRLLNIVLKNAGAGFDPMTAKAQLGTVFANGDLTSVAAIIHKFSKDIVKSKKGSFAVLGAYDLSEKMLVDAKE